MVARPLASRPGTRWCAHRGLHPLDARRHDIALLARQLAEQPQPGSGKVAALASIARRLSCLTDLDSDSIRDRLPSTVIEHNTLRDNKVPDGVSQQRLAQRWPYLPTRRAREQLRGEIRKDARLEMAAVQLTRMIAVNDDPLPLLRCERQVNDEPVEITRDEVADQVRVRERVLHGVQDAAIGARRLQFNDADERERRRAVAAAMLGDQRHVVVGVMRRDRLDIREPGVEPAGVRDRSARQAQRRRRIGCLSPSW